MKKSLKNLLLFLGMMVLTISLELALHNWNVKDENIYLVFVLTILIVLIETRSVYYGILGSAILVLSFDYFITEPTYTFVVNDANNYVSFIMFLVVTFMVNYLLSQLWKQTILAKENEEKIHSLYRFSTDYLHCRTKEEVYQKTLEGLSESLNSEVFLLSEEKKLYGEAEINADLLEAIRAAMKSNAVISSAQPNHKQIKEVIFPINSSNRSYGVICAKDGATLSEKDREFIENVIEELIVVLDKNYISAEQENTKIQVENEKFRTALLRGLSHDIKTPLTMIQGGSSFLMESFDSIDENVRKQLISDIYEESCDLSSFVNNLLDMTRLDEKVKLNRKEEMVDDILAEVSEKMRRRMQKKELHIHSSEELCLVYADASLLSQVFTNLIENAVKHTKADTRIDLYYYKEEEGMRFVVKDNGGGMKEERLKEIFNGFGTIARSEDRTRSHGLGLTICKAIVEAHGGTIEAYNNEEGGLTFEFMIPHRKG